MTEGGELDHGLRAYFNEETTERSFAFSTGRLPSAFVPCLDESNEKPVWNVTAVHPAGCTVVSTGMEESIKNYRPEVKKAGIKIHFSQGPWRITRFSPTPMMSPFGFTLAAGILVSKQKDTPGGVQVRFTVVRGLADRFCDGHLSNARRSYIRQFRSESTPSHLPSTR